MGKISNIININNKNEFNNEVILYSDVTPVLVDFWADWCSPCKIMTPILEKLAFEHLELRVVKVNVDDDNDDISQFYDISSIPTMLLFMNQGPRLRIIGAKSYLALKDEIAKAVKKYSK